MQRHDLYTSKQKREEEEDEEEEEEKADVTVHFSTHEVRDASFLVARYAVSGHQSS